MICGKCLILFAGLTLGIGSPQEAQKPEQPPTKSQQNGPVAAAAEPEYKIGAEDVLKVDVWKEPDVTRQVTVRPDGKISLPLLDDVQAVGLTALELSHMIRDGLKQYITEPQVTVTVIEINSRRVYVTGEVTRPGAYPMLPNMTVLQVLSSCGGFTQFANTKKIYILRMQEGKQVKIPVNYKSLVSGRKPEDNVVLQTGDTVVVP